MLINNQNVTQFYCTCCAKDVPQSQVKKMAVTEHKRRVNEMHQTADSWSGKMFWFGVEAGAIFSGISMKKSESFQGAGKKLVMGLGAGGLVGLVMGKVTAPMISKNIHKDVNRIDVICEDCFGKGHTVNDLTGQPQYSFARRPY